MKPVLVVNHWHDDNRGDSAISEVTLSIAASLCPESSIEVHTISEGTTAETARATRHLSANHPAVTFRPSLLPALALGSSAASAIFWLVRLGLVCAPLLVGRIPSRLEPAANARAVFLVGGSNLFVSGRYRLAGFARLVQLLAPAIAAQRRGVPTYALGHTVGPLEGRAAKWLARRVLSRCTWISIREEASAKLLASLGVPSGHYEVNADMAFGLNVSRNAANEVLEQHSLGGQRFMALALRQHPYASREATDRMVREVSAFAREAVARGWVTRIAVVSQGLGPTSIEDDRALAGQLVAEIGSSAVEVSEDLSAPDLAGLYGAASVLVAVRLHAAILAIAAGTPAFAIGYFTTKTSGVMKLADMPNMSCDFEDVSRELLLERVPRLLEEDAGGAVEHAAASLRASALQVRDRLTA